MNKRINFDPVFDVEKTDSLWTVDFTCIEGKKIDSELLCVESEMGSCLTGVSVKEYIVFFGDGSDCLDRLDCTYLIVGVHDTYHFGIFGNCFFDVFGIDRPFF